MKIFGSICYTHVPDVKRDKLDYRVEVSVFVKNSYASKGYEILNPTIEKIYVSRSLKFNKNGAWNWEKIIGESFNQNIVNNAPYLYDENSEEELSNNEHYALGTLELCKIFTIDVILLYLNLQ